MATLKQKLTNIKNNTNNRLEKFVINYLLKQGKEQEIKVHIEDILKYGTNNGSIAFLIYYVDTFKFFDNFYTEIENLRNDYEDITGQTLQIKGDLKDFMARFGFEETVRIVADLLEIEY